MAGTTRKKIILVNPPFMYFPGMSAGAESYSRPPLGIAYLASYLLSRFSGELDVEIIDCVVEGLWEPAAVCKRLLNAAPDAVGFSVTTGTVTNVGRIAALLKEQRPELPVIAGGPHITALPDEPIAGVDYNVFGEGELSLAELLENHLWNGAGGAIAGVSAFEGGELVYNGGKRPYIENLDEVPIPARELLPQNSYFHSYPYPGVTGFTTMFTSRGCPFDCNFCGNETLWTRRVRYHSIDRVAEELGRITAAGDNLVFFDDDTFTTKRARVLEICEHIRREHPGLQWICHIRADTVDRELLTQMQRAGCREVQVGVESGDEEVLRRTDKKLSLEKIRAAFAILNELKFNSWSTFIIGNDGETPETVRRSIAFAKEINPTYCSFIVLLPFPGTRVFDLYKQRGFITTFDWGKYSWHSDPIISTDALSTADLIKWRKRAYMAFYLRPGKLLQTGLNMVRSRSSRETMRNFRAWLTLVKH